MYVRGSDHFVCVPFFHSLRYSDLTPKKGVSGRSSDPKIEDIFVEDMDYNLESFTMGVYMTKSCDSWDFISYNFPKSLSEF